MRSFYFAKLYTVKGFFVMSAEFWLSLGSLILTTAVGALTILANVRINKISHLKDLHEYQREISYFELLRKDEQWLKDLIDSGEFGKYSKKSQLKIIAWYDAYKKKHPPILMTPNLDDEEYEKLKHTNLRDKHYLQLLGAPGPSDDEIIKDLVEKINTEEFLKHLKDDDLDGTDW